MTQPTALSQHPAPLRQQLSLGEALFSLFGGPLAWFVQLCAGYALATWPCFPEAQRTLAPVAGYAWSLPAMVALLIAGVLVALAAFGVSWRAYARTRDEARFLALWGMLLGAGFAAATSLTAIAFLLVPRCNG
jgi:cytochrome bd-type quinol oxidase subunit 1